MSKLPSSFGQLQQSLYSQAKLQSRSVKDELMTSNSEFRELVREHSRYEERLSELSGLAYPSDEEQLEEVTLKKKKLAIKDQMYSLMLQHEKTASTEH